MKNLYTAVCSLVCLIMVISTLALADDWPTYMHDNTRSGVSSEQFPNQLFLQWQYTAKNQPKPAWPEPAQTDYWHREANLKPRVIYDRTFHLVSVGDFVYFGSSADDKVYCLNAITGQEKWSHFTGAPVRLAPTVREGQVLVGSDDGKVYSLDASNGQLVWQINAGVKKRKILGNERMISISPIRTGVLVDDDVAYFAAGIFPNEGVDLYAVNSSNGEKMWQQSNLGISPQGFLLASAEKLYVPTGRTTPHVFDRKNGKNIGQFDGHGGTYALLQDDALIYGGGDLGTLNVKSDDAKDNIASFNGLQMVVKGDISYLRSDTEISAVNRKTYFDNYKKWAKISEKQNKLANALWDLREKRKYSDKKYFPEIDDSIEELVDKINDVKIKQKQLEDSGILWEIPANKTFSMILSGNLLFIGSENHIYSLDAKTGEKAWASDVDGNVYGLAVANGRLFASTDNGNIYCFAAGKIKSKSNKQELKKNPYKRDKYTRLYAKAAETILKESGVKKGYCLVLDAEQGRLAYELARRSELQIIGIEDDPVNIENARRALDAAGYYGNRISIQYGDLQHLPYSKYVANLVVSDKALVTGALETDPEEAIRIAKPFGGVVLIGSKNEKNWLADVTDPNWKRIPGKMSWLKYTKGSIKSAGEWTHLYSNPANTSSSLDPINAPLQIQWFGRPGPRKIINRHSRPMSTLFKDGRLFIPANNRIIAVDAYNGTLLWEREVPDSRILGALKDTGHMAVTTDLIYIATHDNCLGINVDDGAVNVTLNVPQLISGQNRQWGYLALSGNQVFGSGKKAGSSFSILGRYNCDQFEGDYREMILSDYLFSLDRKTGKEFWRYQKGVVFNNTITLDENFIYFIESRNNVAMSDPDGRLQVDDFCKSDTYIVKLNKRTGEKMWEKPYHFPYSQIMYLANANNTLVVTGSYNEGRHVHYGLFAFDCETGDQKWKNSYQGGNSRWDNSTKKSTIGGSHGEQWQHPVIIEDTVFLPPYNFDLSTGKRGSLYLTRGGGGCGGLSGSLSFLFARGSNPRIYDISKTRESGTPITRVNRPGCWINIIPAGDLVSIPESSSGCTCDYPIQSSFVFVSQDNN